MHNVFIEVLVFMCGHIDDRFHGQYICVSKWETNVIYCIIVFNLYLQHFFGGKKPTCYNKTINYFKTKKPTTKKVLVSVATQVKLLFMNINHKSQSINVWVSREHLQRLGKPSQF